MFQRHIGPVTAEAGRCERTHMPRIRALLPMSDIRAAVQRRKRRGFWRRLYATTLNRSHLSADDVADALDHFSCRVSFQFEEFAVLADRRRLPLPTAPRQARLQQRRAQDRWLGPVDIWACTTLGSTEADLRNTVLPVAVDTEDQHPWKWLTERIRAHGVEVTSSQLKRLPYNVELSPAHSRNRP
jgi:hypothetical protein